CAYRRARGTPSSLSLVKPDESNASALVAEHRFEHPEARAATGPALRPLDDADHRSPLPVLDPGGRRHDAPVEVAPGSMLEEAVDGGNPEPAELRGGGGADARNFQGIIGQRRPHRACPVPRASRRSDPALRRRNAGPDSALGGVGAPPALRWTRLHARLRPSRATQEAPLQRGVRASALEPSPSPAPFPPAPRSRLPGRAKASR